MKVYILDVNGESREQMLLWLAEDKRLTGFEVFDDYIRFIEQTGKSPPDFCIIRLGENRIPGLKTADMVRQISSDTRIVFVADDREHAVNAYEIGGYGYLLGPVNKKQFEKCFEQRKSEDLV